MARPLLSKNDKLIDKAFMMAAEGKSDSEIMKSLGMSGTEFEVWKVTHPLVGLHFATIRAKNRYRLSPSDRPSPEILKEMAETAGYDADKFFEIFGLSVFALRIWHKRYPVLRDLLNEILRFKA